MVHGRDHDERFQKYHPHRHNNTPDDPESEVGTEREPERGSDVAPTRKALEEERERHAREAAEGVLAAGTGGRRKQERK